MELVSGKTGCLVWSAGFDAAPGEHACGDAFQLSEQNGETLLAIVDGLGHGPSAAEASRCALQALFRDATSLQERLRAAHAELSRMRGAAAGVMSIDSASGRLGWLSVGNVEAAVHQGGLARSKWLRLFVQSGLVGQRLPPLRVAETTLSRDSVIVVTTDGIHGDLLDDVLSAPEPESFVGHALSHHRVTADDALIFVGRFVSEDA